jgi:hypothetical protein
MITEVKVPGALEPLFTTELTGLVHIVAGDYIVYDGKIHHVIERHWLVDYAHEVELLVILIEKPQ